MALSLYCCRYCNKLATHHYTYEGCRRDPPFPSYKDMHSACDEHVRDMIYNKYGGEHISASWHRLTDEELLKIDPIFFVSLIHNS
jgi:hypothetical protein